VIAEVARRSRRRWAPALLASVALGAAPGCAPTIPYTYGTSVSKSSVRAIQPGNTTKYELLETFGMPLAIAKKGETVLIPRGREHSADRPGSPSTPARFASASGDGLFEPFSARPVGSGHRVYYFAHTISTKRALVLFTYIREWTESRSDELWCLVNEHNGIVEDCVFRPAGGA
jgi:hypothetical protein